MRGIGLCILADGRYAVARIAARTGRHGTVIKGRRDEAAGVMAKPTIRGGRDMADFFTLREDTVVAGLTIVDDTHMIEGRGFKARGEVTHAAIFVGWHVVADFPHGDNAVVTDGAVIHDARVIELGTGKGRGVMTNGTILRGGNVIRRFDGRRCHAAIVALRAVVNDTRVIEHRSGKTAGHVTHAAILRGRHVADVLLGRRAGGTITMAFRAVIHPAGMIEDAVSEARADAMARPAIVAGDLVIGRLAQGIGRRGIASVVTRSTIAGDTRVIENLRSEGNVGVTEITILRRRQMACRFHTRGRIGEELRFMAAFAAG